LQRGLRGCFISAAWRGRGRVRASCHRCRWRRVPPPCGGAMWRSVVVKDVRPGRIVVVHLEVLSSARQLFAGLCNVGTTCRIRRKLFALVLVFSCNGSDRNGVSFTGSSTASAGSHYDGAPCLGGRTCGPRQSVRRQLCNDGCHGRRPGRNSRPTTGWSKTAIT
jgi:hypothetical protein